MTEFTPKQIEAARDVIIAAESWIEEHGVDVALRVARAALLASKAAEMPASVEGRELAFLQPEGESK